MLQSSRPVQTLPGTHAHSWTSSYPPLEGAGVADGGCPAILSSLTLGNLQPETWHLGELFFPTPRDRDGGAEAVIVSHVVPIP